MDFCKCEWPKPACNTHNIDRFILITSLLTNSIGGKRQSAQNLLSKLKGQHLLLPCRLTADSPIHPIVSPKHINGNNVMITDSATMRNDLVITRKLGLTENFFRCRTEVDFYRNFFAVGAYNRDLTQNWPLVYRALRKTILDYHILICNVFKDVLAGYTIFRPIEQATLGDLVEMYPALFSPLGKPVSEEFMNMLLRKLYFRLYEEKPLFKLVFAGTHDLGVTFEHTVADGVVAPYFHEVFLKNLAYCDNLDNDAEYVKLYGPAPVTVDVDTPVFVYADDVGYIKHSLPPPMEMGMQDPSIDYADNDPDHYSKVVPEGYPERWPGRFPATKEYSVAFKLINIPPAQLKSILLRCKEHKVTLTSFIAFTQAMALQPIYGEKHHFLTVIAVTLRRFLTPEVIDSSYSDLFEDKDYKIMGNYAHMGLRETFAPVKDFSWEKVKSVNDHLAQTVTNNKILSTMKPFFDAADELSDNKELFTPALAQNKVDGTKISNLGYINLPVYEAKAKEWTINDITFGQDLAPAASEFVLSVISTPRGGLNLVLSYYDHCFDDTEYVNFDEFAGRLRRLLLENAGVDT